MAKRRTNKSLTFLFTVCALIIGLVAGFIASVYLSLPDSYIIPDSVEPQAHIATGNIDVDIVKSNDLSIHFIELGNKYTGDCTLIKVGDVEVLIDAGSKADSIPYIKEYLDKYVDDKLDYVVVTHAHEDHYAGFSTSNYNNSLFYYYEVGTIIEFAKTNKTTNAMYLNYVNNRNKEIETDNAKCYTALDCVNEENGASRNYDLTHDVTMQILYQRYYEDTAKTENEYSVCLQIIQGDKKYLFTGDLEKEGEKSLVEENATGKKNENMLSQVELYKAGHHGSKTSSSTELLEVVQPKNICVCCCAGSSEYTTKDQNQFPTQEFVNRASPYTSNIYVTTLCIDYKANSFTSMNGTIVFCGNKNNSSIETRWYFSNNATKLKDTEWFSKHRTLPNNAAA